MSEIAQTDNFNDKTNIKVVGVGGAGGNAVNRMIAEGLQSVEFIAINTDAKDLMRSDADVKISLNDATSRGLGAGADPEKGAKAAQDHLREIVPVLLVIGKACAGFIEECLLRELDVLCEMPDAVSPWRHNLSAVCVVLFENHPEKGGFPRTIRADEGETFTSQH